MLSSIAESRHKESCVYAYKRYNSIIASIDKLREPIWAPETSHPLLLMIDIAGKATEWFGEKAYKDAYKRACDSVKEDLISRMPKKYGSGVLVKIYVLGKWDVRAEIVSAGEALSIAWKGRREQKQFSNAGTVVTYAWASNSPLLKYSPLDEMTFKIHNEIHERDRKRREVLTGTCIAR